MPGNGSDSVSKLYVHVSVVIRKAGRITKMKDVIYFEKEFEKKRKQHFSRRHQFSSRLGDSDIGKVAQYELSQMYAVSLDEIEKLISSEETMN